MFSCDTSTLKREQARIVECLKNNFNSVTNTGEKYIAQRVAFVSAVELNFRSFVFSNCLMQKTFFNALETCLFKNIKQSLNVSYTTDLLRFAYVNSRWIHSKSVKSELMRHIYSWNVLNYLIPLESPQTREINLMWSMRWHLPQGFLT